MSEEMLPQQQRDIVYLIVRMSGNALTREQAAWVLMLAVLVIAVIAGRICISVFAGKPGLPPGIHGNAQGIPQPTPQQIRAQGGSITYP